MTDSKAKTQPKRSNGNGTKANGSKANGAKHTPAKGTTIPAVMAAEEAIRERAFYLFVSRGMQHGMHEQDWRRAEQEILGR
ncbi:MAG: DUF2934 domain-containing protein [Terracidiphilus sp.]